MAPEETVVSAAGRRHVGADELLVFHGGDEAGVGASSHASGEVVGEVAAECASVIGCAHRTIVDFRGGGVAEVHIGLVLVAGEEFQAFAVRVEVAAVLCVAVSQAGGGEALAVIVNDH